MEYGSEFDWRANAPYRRENTGFVRGDWLLYRSGRDALKAFARSTGKTRVLLPALCCESMILPFTQNGCEVVFYRLNEDLSGKEDDVREKLTDGAVLLYMRYFGVPPFSDAFLTSLRESGHGYRFLEDRTHDILIPREDGGFQPDAVTASLRKWAALPEGGMLRSAQPVDPGWPDPAYGDLRQEAMKEKSRYLDWEDPELKQWYSEKLRRAEGLLDESGEPAAMSPEYRELLEKLDFSGILAARFRNLRRLERGLRPLAEEGLIRFLIPEPEKSGLYLPILVEERDRVQRAMFTYKIYCPAAIWPEPREAAGVCPVSHRFTEHMLSLLCDQRYDEGDMDYQIRALTEILHKRGRET